MYIKLIFKNAINNKQMYSPRLILMYIVIPTIHAFGSVLLTHTLLVQTHIHDVSVPWLHP